MRRISINGALFMFMKRGEKLTHDAIWNDAWGPQNRYVLWPRGEFWDVRFKNVVDRKLQWLPLAEKHFENEDEAWQAAYMHWENQTCRKSKGKEKVIVINENNIFNYPASNKAG